MTSTPGRGQLRQISPSTQIPDGEVAAGVELGWDVPADPEVPEVPEDEVSEVPDVPEDPEVPDPVPSVAVRAGGWVADVPVPAVVVSAEGVGAVRCAAAFDVVRGAAVYGCVLVESVWITVAPERCCEVPVVEDWELVVEGFRCLPVPAGGSSAVWSADCSSAPMVERPVAVDAWARWPEPPSIEATVRPPPTSATVVATTARRWFFFQWARCRRRAARPCGEGAGPSASLSAPSKAPPESSKTLPASSWAPYASVPSGAATSGQSAVAAGAGTVRSSAVNGAMSGA
ncbi:hypothetical protein ACIO93_35070 [Streptomyces sp. NPDC087903]|uniref:hypothetical protein n=1 Tax=Streptomyces sp. NPDC087903 TaxID=3365819 RepID=UPI00381E8017